MTPKPPPSASDIVAAIRAGRMADVRKAADHLFKHRTIEVPTSLLVEALARLADRPVSWETTYKLVLAVGATGDASAIDFARSLLPRSLPAVRTAIGHALVLLGSRHRTLDAVLADLPRAAHPFLLDGVMRGLGVEHATVSDDVATSLLRRVMAGPTEDYFWAAVACHRWLHLPIAVEFLTTLAAPAGTPETREAAALSLAGKTRRWTHF